MRFILKECFFFIFCLFSFVLFSCSDPNEPSKHMDNGPDTTSHEFVWQIDTIGSYNSIFRDVAVINDTLIWAVGTIFDDEREKYGAAIWNGKEWNLKYFRLPDMSGGTITPHGIWAFNENDIWLVWGHIYNWNGQEFKQVHEITEPIGGIDKIWASSENDIWFVGTMGLIIHYNGSDFTTMETGTNINLTDVWGTSKYNVWASGYTEGSGTVILHYNGSSWSKFHELSWDDCYDLHTSIISGLAVSIWTDSKDYIWIITYWGLYKVNSKDPKDFIIYPDMDGWVNKLRGIAANDIVICGDYTDFWHFNGKSIFYYPELKGHVSFTSITTYNNNFYIVGQDYETDRAILITGTR